MNAVKRWLSNTPESWVLILDNADDPRLDISQYFPVGNRGVILITTRNQNCGIYATVWKYFLGAMTTDEAITLILKTAGVHDPSDASARETAKPVVDKLGCLALAIAQAGAVIREGRCRMEEYCAIYSRHRQKLLSEKAVQGQGYQYTVYTTWEVSWNMIAAMSGEVGRDAIELLNIFSFLHHEGIPEAMFHRAWEMMSSEPPYGWILSSPPRIVLRQTSDEWDVYPLRAAVSLLLSFSLINRDKDHLISIHPLVHTWARDRLSPSNQELVWQQTVSTVALSVPWSDQTVDYRYRRSLVPHVDACLGKPIDGLLRCHDAIPDFQRMVEDFTRVYKESGRSQDALQLIVKVVEVNKRSFGEEHPDTLRSVRDLAVPYGLTGHPQEALRLMQHVVKVAKRALGMGHLETIASLHSLAIEYGARGHTQKALPVLEQLVKASMKTLGEEHSFTLIFMDNLAINYGRVGQHISALKLTERVVEAHKKMLGEENPETLVSMNSLANRYDALGRRDEALELTERVVDACKRSLGVEHPDTLRSIYNLAIIYKEVGRGQEALEIMERLVEANKRIRGEEHPRTSNSIHCLADWYRGTGRRQEALKLVCTLLRCAFLLICIGVAL